MQEKNIENFLKQCVELKGGLCLKFISPGLTGVPDRIVLLPQGKIFFVELKAPGKKPKPHQERLHKIFEKLGARVYVADTKEKVMELLGNETQNKTIGDKIRERREELGMTQVELAERTGYKSRSSINKVENGTNDIPQSKVAHFAKALNTTVSYLMEDIE